MKNQRQSLNLDYYIRISNKIEIFRISMWLTRSVMLELDTLTIIIIAAWLPQLVSIKKSNTVLSNCLSQEYSTQHLVNIF